MILRVWDRIAGPWVPVLFLISIWELLTDLTGYLDPVLFPGLIKIIKVLIYNFDKLVVSLLSSLGLLLPSYLLAVMLGIGVGTLVGWHPRARNLLMPIFHGLSPIPPTLYIPYAIALLPTFWTSSVFIIFIGALWPVLLSAIRGVILIEEKYLDNARILGLSGWKLASKIVLPAASPHIFNGAATGLVFSFILLTVAEMFGARSGLGWFITYYADFSDYARVLAGMIFISLFITVVMNSFTALQNYCLAWVSKR